MQLTVASTVVIPNDITYFDYFSTAIEAGGLRIKAKSKLFADWILRSQVLKTGDGTPRTLIERPMWDDVQDGEPHFYLPTTEWQGGEKTYGFAPSRNVTSDFFYSERPNLTWLFHINLGEGMELLVKQPISFNNWEDYHGSCISAINEIYANELRQASILTTFMEKGPVTLEE